mmetsp:Transcript_48568/g.121249  ORF Transcript_48568/g.121249 Transcript_48568/m.121249 type:complete len:157 (-) Transcript_48568:119-589(-)|eukprot:CAMPEP_0173464300 /NCGR_PEP_ID=MMETSP1357-20121228/69672_1 /TAXON_ID=77926 /ORGANISM="Hemiselmis rufescens, Strain PCC563" /LENGTH=156 /DNA_ID=CAMNT_0014432185 /DNA_START=108 /DNA_END=581 /DNA_ORIENTATION=+
MLRGVALAALVALSCGGAAAVVQTNAKLLFALPPSLCGTARRVVYGKGASKLCVSENRVRATRCLGGLDMLGGESESEERRLQYQKDRAEREKGLLQDRLKLAEGAMDGDDERPEFIDRWGGADLAAEGPTRKVLELMSDSEWATDDWATEEAEDS